MFGLGDDFDIDESFLDEVLEVEKARGRNGNGDNSATVGCSSSDVETPKDIYPSSTPTSHPTVVRENRSVSVTLPSGVKIRERRFPGPAGLLPQRHGNSSLIATEDFIGELEEELRSDAQFNEEKVLSQESALNLESPGWTELLRDLGPDGKELLRNLNVASVSSKARQKKALKAPFLALVIQSVDTSTPDPCLYLSDTSGEMVGAVHREVWEQLGDDMVVGAVLVLINVGVLCAGQSSSRCYLNITSNNIASLYTPCKGNDIRVSNMVPLSEPDCLKFMQTWHKLLTSPAPQPRYTERQERQLFSTPSFGSGSLRPSVQNRRLPSVKSPLSGLPMSGFSAFPSNCDSPLWRSPNNFHPTNNRSSNPACSKRESFSQFPNTPCSSKRPRYEEERSQETVSDVASQSIVENLLDGIDTDSLFGDF